MMTIHVSGGGAFACLAMKIVKCLRILSQFQKIFSALLVAQRIYRTSALDAKKTSVLTVTMSYTCLLKMMSIQTCSWGGTFACLAMKNVKCLRILSQFH